MSVEVDELLAKYGIAEKSTKTITDAHLENISQDHCEEWRRLPSHLGMSRMSYKDIDRMPRSELQKRLDFFIKWKQQKGHSCTYKKLISALLEIKSREDAEYICTLLKGPGIKSQSSQTDKKEGEEVNESATSPKSKGDDQDSEEQDGKAKPVKIVLLGKKGAGKSTLKYNIFRRETDPEYLETVQTEEVKVDMQIVDYKYQENGVKVTVIDTIGLLGAGKKKRDKLLKDLSEHADKANLAIYCISVDTQVRFEAENPEIMRALEHHFGRNIWRHCILVLTFSNRALEYYTKLYGEGEKSKSKWKLHIEEVIKNFQAQIKVDNVKTELKLPSTSPQPESYLETASNSEPQSEAAACPIYTIPVITAGWGFKDQTSPDAKEPWLNTFFKEALDKMDEKSSRDLLEYRYGRELVKRAFRAIDGSAKRASDLLAAIIKIQNHQPTAANSPYTKIAPDEQKYDC